MLFQHFMPLHLHHPHKPALCAVVGRPHGSVGVWALGGSVVGSWCVGVLAGQQVGGLVGWHVGV